DPNYDKFKGYQSKYNTPNSLHTASVTSIARDAQGRFWVAMDGGGIDVIDPKTDSFIHINKNSQVPYSGMDADYILAVYTDSQGNLWAGSWGKGVYLLKKGSQRFVNFNQHNSGLTSDIIVSITEDSKGRLWFGS